MNQIVGKDAYPLYIEDVDFVYGLCHQNSNDSLLNYITARFNSKPEHNSRKLLIYDWIRTLRWVLDKVEHYETRDLHTSFFSRYFNDSLSDVKFEHLYKALYLFENIDNYDDMQLVGNKEFVQCQIPELPEEIHEQVINEDILSQNRNDFFSFSLYEQEDMIKVYKSYIQQQKSMTMTESWDVETLEDYVIYHLAIDKLTEEYKTEENIALVNKVCKHFVHKRNSTPNTSISDDEITELLTEGLFVQKNMILTAYYLQYILMSLGASIPINQTRDGVRVNKVAGKQTDIMQRLLCAATTHNWSAIEQKGNSYYVTIARMFNLKNKNIEEKESVLKHLKKVQEKLKKDGFNDALKLLDNDIEKIRAFK